jgi:organic hydroperoxide reductase OsmC/OhrA
MDIAATVSSGREHQVTVQTGTTARALDIPARPDRRGLAVNGGELLMAALATCYCNDLYREAARLGIPIEGVRVRAMARFPGVGLAATGIRYHARVDSPASPADIARLLRETDAVAEVHNTLRSAATVRLLPEPADEDRPA